MTPTEDLKRVYQAYLDNEAASPAPGLREAVIEECAKTIDGMMVDDEGRIIIQRRLVVATIRALSRPVSEREDGQ